MDDDFIKPILERNRLDLGQAEIKSETITDFQSSFFTENDIDFGNQNQEARTDHLDIDWFEQDSNEIRDTESSDGNLQTKALDGTEERELEQFQVGFLQTLQIYDWFDSVYEQEKETKISNTAKHHRETNESKDITIDELHVEPVCVSLQEDLKHMEVTDDTRKPSIEAVATFSQEPRFESGPSEENIIEVSEWVETTSDAVEREYTADFSSISLERPASPEAVDDDFIKPVIDTGVSALAQPEEELKTFVGFPNSFSEENDMDFGNEMQEASIDPSNINWYDDDSGELVDSKPEEKEHDNGEHHFGIKEDPDYGAKLEEVQTMMAHFSRRVGSGADRCQLDVIDAVDHLVEKMAYELQQGTLSSKEIMQGLSNLRSMQRRQSFSSESDDKVHAMEEKSTSPTESESSTGQELSSYPSNTFVDESVREKLEREIYDILDEMMSLLGAVSTQNDKENKESQFMEEVVVSNSSEVQMNKPTKVICEKLALVVPVNTPLDEEPYMDDESFPGHEFINMVDLGRKESPVYETDEFQKLYACSESYNREISSQEDLEGQRGELLFRLETRYYLDKQGRRQILDEKGLLKDSEDKRHKTNNSEESEFARYSKPDCSLDVDEEQRIQLLDPQNDVLGTSAIDNDLGVTNIQNKLQAEKNHELHQTPEFKASQSELQVLADKLGNKETQRDVWKEQKENDSAEEKGEKAEEKGEKENDEADDHDDDDHDDDEDEEEEETEDTDDGKGDDNEDKHDDEDDTGSENDDDDNDEKDDENEDNDEDHDKNNDEYEDNDENYNENKEEQTKQYQCRGEQNQHQKLDISMTFQEQEVQAQSQEQNFEDGRENMEVSNTEKKCQESKTSLSYLQQIKCDMENVSEKNLNETEGKDEDRKYMQHRAPEPDLQSSREDSLRKESSGNNCIALPKDAESEDSLFPWEMSTSQEQMQTSFEEHLTDEVAENIVNQVLASQEQRCRQNNQQSQDSFTISPISIKSGHEGKSLLSRKEMSENLYHCGFEEDGGYHRKLENFSCDSENNDTLESSTNLLRESAVGVFTEEDTKNVVFTGKAILQVEKICISESEQKTDLKEENQELLEKENKQTVASKEKVTQHTSDCSSQLGKEEISEESEDDDEEDSSEEEDESDEEDDDDFDDGESYSSEGTDSESEFVTPQHQERLCDEVASAISQEIVLMAEVEVAMEDATSSKLSPLSPSIEKVGATAFELYANAGKQLFASEVSEADGAEKEQTQRKKTMSRSKMRRLQRKKLKQFLKTDAEFDASKDSVASGLVDASSEVKKKKKKRKKKKKKKGSPEQEHGRDEQHISITTSSSSLSHTLEDRPEETDTVNPQNTKTSEQIKKKASEENHPKQPKTQGFEVQPENQRVTETTQSKRANRPTCISRSEIPVFKTDEATDHYKCEISERKSRQPNYEVDEDCDGKKAQFLMPSAPSQRRSRSRSRSPAPPSLRRLTGQSPRRKPRGNILKIPKPN